MRRRLRACGDMLFVQIDIRFRVGRACRDEDGNIIRVPEGFPKNKHRRTPAAAKR